MVKLIFDASNILFRVASITEKRGEELGGTFFESDEQKAAFALHSSLNSILKYYRKFRPNEIALAFEGRNNWRKSYTSDRKDQIAKQYKANRLPSDKSQSFFTLIDDFKALIKDHTSMICLAVDGLEGDDVIAGYVQEDADNPDDKVIIVSGDKDFMQLGRFKNVQLIDPATGKDRLKAEPNFDFEYFLFEKCIRGDAGDNVMSAFPRVRKTRLDKAYADDYEMTQLMQEEWTSPEEDTDGNQIFNEDGTPKLRINKVGELYKHNKVLMDLACQPDDVKEKIKAGIAEARLNVGKFNHFHFMRFLGKHKLEAIANQAHIYTEMLSTKASKNQIIGTEPQQDKIKSDGAIKASDFLKKTAKESSLLEF